MSSIQPLPPPESASRLLGVIRWLLPLALAVLAVAIEWSEHLANGDEPITTAFVGEVVLFAGVGPMAVALTLGWVAGLVDGYRATEAAVETMNRSLEANVADRTRHLEQATAQLATANNELRQLDRMKSEFVALVSHQLRAPLTNITGALELVAQDAERLPDGSRRTLQILQSEIDRLAHLIGSILDVSRIEAGRLTPRLGPVAVEPLLSRACVAIAEAEPDRPLRRSVPAGLPPAWADEVLLGEVVRNLIENAVRYSPAGSPIEVVGLVRDGSIEISVTDHGPGVPPESQALIFRSFAQLGDAEGGPTGYGLGLYFADRLVRAQGGTIGVDSPVWPDPAGPGARFVVTVPVAPDEPPEAGS